MAPEPRRAEAIPAAGITAAAPSPALSRGQRVLAAAALANVLATLDINIVSIAIPDIVHSFPGITLPQVSWVLNGYTVFFAASLLPAGALADRFGARRLFSCAVALFTAGSLACALAPSVLGLTAARMVQALGGGGMVTLAIYIGLSALPDRPGQVFSLLSWTGGVAAAASPTIGGLLLLAGGWRVIFFAALPVAVAVLILARAVPRPPAGSVPGGLPDFPGIIATAGSVGILALLAVQVPAWGWGSPRSLAVLAGGVLLSVAAVIRSLRHPRATMDLRLLRTRATAAGNAGLVALSVPQFSAVVCATLFLIHRWHLTAPAAGLALTPGLISMSVAAWASGRLVRRVGARPVGVAGSLLGAAGLAWFALHSGAAPAYATAFLPGLLVGFAGMGLSGVVMSAVAVAQVPPESRGKGSALVMLSRSTGAVVGVATIARLLAVPAITHFQLAWLVLAAGMVLMGAAVVLAGPAVRATPSRAARTTGD